MISARISLESNPESPIAPRTPSCTDILLTMSLLIDPHRTIWATSMVLSSVTRNPWSVIKYELAESDIGGGLNLDKFRFNI